MRIHVWLTPVELSVLSRTKPMCEWFVTDELLNDSMQKHSFVFLYMCLWWNHHHHREVLTDRCAPPWPLATSDLHIVDNGLASASWMWLSHVRHHRHGRPEGRLWPPMAASRWLMASCPLDCSPSAEGQHSPAHLSPGGQCNWTLNDGNGILQTILWWVTIRIVWCIVWIK